MLTEYLLMAHLFIVSPNHHEEDSFFKMEPSVENEVSLV